jgi:hypothetical protein
VNYCLLNRLHDLQKNKEVIKITTEIIDKQQIYKELLNLISNTRKDNVVNLMQIILENFGGYNGSN